MSNTYEMQPISTAVQVLPRVRQKRHLPIIKNDTYTLAENAACQDLLRAALAKQALDNTAVLAKLEEHYNSLAPSASGDYRYIVQTYAKAAMSRILEGGW